MLRRRSVHKDMADFNGYTAKRLREMAESFAGLSKAFGGNSGETGLSREDGAAAIGPGIRQIFPDCLYILKNAKVCRLGGIFLC